MYRLLYMDYYNRITRMKEIIIVSLIVLVKLITFANAADIDTSASNNSANNIMSYGILITIMSIAFIVTTVMRGIKKK